MSIPSNQPTSWSINPSANASTYPYDSSAHAYNSLSDNYSGVVAGESQITVLTPTSWTDITNTATSWVVNPNIDSGAYDTTNVYDATTDGYDDVTAGQSTITIINPTVWTQV